MDDIYVVDSSSIETGTEFLNGLYNSYVSPHYIVCLCHSGSLELDYDGQRRLFRTHDIAIVYPYHSITPLNFTPDYKYTYICVPSKVYDRMAQLKMNNKRISFEQVPQFRLTDFQYEDMVVFIDNLKRINKLDLNDKDVILVHSVYILSFLINHFHDVNVSSAIEARQLSYDLYGVLAQYYTEHRDVQFYANHFCLSPKHFSSVVKQETGHTASYWIHHFVVSRAKQILTYEPNVSVQDVSDRLGFPDQASFCRYFKRDTGLSPTDYRNTTCKNTNL